MRRRSGALHCESELDFIQLAEAAHDHIGIFYDERTNRKIMNHLRPKKQPVANPELSAEKRKDYSGFEFGLESEAEREEREQLSRANLETIRQLHLTLLTPHPARTVTRLGQQKWETGRQLQLVTEQQGNCLVRYWIMSREELTSDGLRNVYLKHCGVLLEETGGEWVVQRGSDEWGELVEEVRRRLND